MFCREQVAQLRDILPEIEAAGASLVVVGNGTAPMLRGFVEDFGAGLEIYTDPSKRVYEALDARRPGARAMLDPRLVLNTLRALVRGHLPRRRQGDPAQLGGVWVVRLGGEAVYEHRSNVAGDNPPNNEVVHAVKGVQSAR